jgi:aminopeptidase-like protein
MPIHARLSLTELKQHLFSLPDRPDWIPYRTSYYKENWGFCLSHNQLQALSDGEYEVFIDSTLGEGSLSYGECVLEGACDEEILLTCHVCHPSLANDNLSGIALNTHLAQWLLQQPRRYSYRFLFIPGTIGSITWLSRNEAVVPRIKHGLIVTGVGDGGPFSYKQTRIGNADIDRVAQHVLKHAGVAHNVMEFYPYGYDERQFCSPGFNLPIGRLTRSTHDQYREYHTSADNLDLVRPEYLEESLEVFKIVLDVLEHNRVWVNQNPKCEPMLGKHGLYSSIGAAMDAKTREMAYLWVLNLADGRHDLLAIAERAGMPFAVIKAAADALHKSGLLAEAQAS